MLLRAASLRTRITLALVATGLIAAVLVGVIARFVLLDQFNSIVLESSFTAFQGDITAYIETYGSFDAAERAEPFPDFARRRRDTVPGPSRQGVGAFADREPGQPRGTPSADFVPPFMFLLLDPDGRVLRGLDQYPAGSAAPADVRAQGRPITVRGAVVAYAVPIAQPNLNRFDESYLAAMQNAVLYGILGAVAFAVALGFFFSHRLSASLGALTRAMQAMERGDLEQQVTVTTRDEFGFLADTFNRMSRTLRDQSERLRELSLTDDVTGLRNRRYFDEQAGHTFAQARRYGRPFSVALADIDLFKQINDSHSHATGDAVLTQVARILASSLRESDIVARYGGEEFAVAFPETPLPEAIATCERVRRAVREFDWDGVQPGLTVTITVGLDAQVARGSLQQMLSAADARLYEGKQEGRDRVRADAEPERI